MSLLEDKAAAICNKLEQHPDFKIHFGVDPTPPPVPSPHPFRGFVMQLLQQFMPMILGCFATPAGVRSAMQNPSRGIKLLAGMHIRRALRSNDEADDWAVPVLKEAFFSVAKDTTEPEYTELLG